MCTFHEIYKSFYMIKEMFNSKFQGCPELSIAAFEGTNNSLLLIRYIKQTLYESDHYLFVYDVYSLHPNMICVKCYTSTVIYKNVMES